MQSSSFFSRYKHAHERQGRSPDHGGFTAKQRGPQLKTAEIDELLISGKLRLDFFGGN